MAQYDEEELKMRSSMYDLAVPLTRMINLFMIWEWDALRARYRFSEDDYPALKRMINSLRDPSPFDELCKNPMLKLAMITNPTLDKTEDGDFNGDS